MHIKAEGMIQFDIFHVFVYWLLDLLSKILMYLAL